MKDEVPPTIVDAHIKSVQSAVKKGETIDSNTFNIEKSGIAGTDKEGMYRCTHQGFPLKITFVHTIISLVLRCSLRLICVFIQ